jgi:hypothetical protein
VLAAGGFLLSDASLVYGSGGLERTLGSIVPGAPMILRADASGLSLALLATAAALVALLEGSRRPLERTALLLCLAGAYLGALAGTVVLLFAGLELGNVGALLMVAGGWGTLGRRGLITFAVQHVSALGLLAAALQLQNSSGTTDLSALPGGALTMTVAAPWAIAGAVRLLAAMGLPGSPGRRPSIAWASVAAVPGGLAVLLRLQQAAGAQGLPGSVAQMLMIGGSVVAVAGGALAISERRNPTATGRALCLAAAGPVIALAGVGSAAATVAAVAAALALLLALAMAPAWGSGGDEGSGEAARWLRAVSLAAAGGIPLGYGTAALLLGAGAGAAQGLPQSLVGVAIGVGGVLTAVAAALAARTVLASPPPAGSGPGLRFDGAAATVAAVVMGVVPGLTLGAVVDRIAERGSGVVALGSTAVTGPGGGWAGGYLMVATLLAVIAAVSAAAVAGLPRPRAERRHPPPPVAAAEPWWWAELVRVGSALDSGMAATDRWLTSQPGLGLIVVAVAFRAVLLR